MRRRYLVRFLVSPDSLTWLVEHEGHLLSRHCRKRDAVREGARQARTGAPSILVVERMDGTRQSARRYGREPRGR
nr:DUF2188 domain-containing protein [Qaidamihabitans albus]